VVDVFFTDATYRLWSERALPHLSYFCQFLVHLETPSTWIPLSTSSTSDVVLHRLASSRVFDRLGALSTTLDTPQPHVRVSVFMTSIARAIYDRLISVRHVRHDMVRSYIKVLCDSDTWRLVFKPIIPHAILKHHSRYIRVTITGYPLLYQWIFPAWTHFPNRAFIDHATFSHPHPPLYRVDDSMTFTFYPHSTRAPRLCVAFTWERYLWDGVNHRYEGIGPRDWYIEY